MVVFAFIEIGSEVLSCLRFEIRRKIGEVDVESPCDFLRGDIEVDVVINQFLRLKDNRIVRNLGPRDDDVLYMKQR